MQMFFILYNYRRIWIWCKASVPSVYTLSYLEMFHICFSVQYKSVLYIHSCIMFTHLNVKWNTSYVGCNISTHILYNEGKRMSQISPFLPPFPHLPFRNPVVRYALIYIPQTVTHKTDTHGEIVAVYANFSKLGAFGSHHLTPAVAQVSMLKQKKTLSPFLCLLFSRSLWQ